MGGRFQNLGRMNWPRLLFCVCLAVTMALITGCMALPLAGAATDPTWSLDTQQKMMDRQLGQTAHDRASAPAWMGYR